MRSLLHLAFAGALVFEALPATAAPITEQFTVTATDFTDTLVDFPGAPPLQTPPVSTYTIVFQLTLDPANPPPENIYGNPTYTQGLTIISSTLPTGPAGFVYERAGLVYPGSPEFLSILSLSLDAGFQSFTPQVEVAIEPVFFGTPELLSLDYGTETSPGRFESGSGTVTGIVIDSATVDEPTSVKLLLGALAMFGLLFIVDRVIRRWGELVPN